MSSSASEDENYEDLKASFNRKHKKAGGWQMMGLDHPVYKAINKQGYLQPTPIQRKSIPPILEGRDVVAMSRTGSGKTAAFVIPMLQKLKQRDVKGYRALILSPTRELTLQTYKVVKELGRFTGLRCACLIGGDNMEGQFEALHQNPDILIATPGRLLHIAVEMNLRLNHVNYVVFDEADRLFEMGFMEQLYDILKRLPDDRQTMLFSATLPKLLVDFANAGLSDPLLVRLDVDNKLSEKLCLQFFLCRENDKISALLYLCHDFVRRKEQTIIFCATIRHVEYFGTIFNEAGLDYSFIHSQLDPTARRQNIQRFHSKETLLLLVTDVAARGVDIPLLDNTINVHFPTKPKLFVHRVGRVARAGKSGRAFSLVSYDELAYVVDLFLFLGRELQVATNESVSSDSEFLIGKFSDKQIHLESEFLKNLHEKSVEVSDLQHKCENAMGKFNRTKQPPSAESVRRVKSHYRHVEMVEHPYFKDPEETVEQTNFLTNLKNWRPNATIFELNIGSKTESSKVMKDKRKVHQKIIVGKKRAFAMSESAGEDVVDGGEKSTIDSPVKASLPLAEKIVGNRKRTRQEAIEKEKAENYISYLPSDHLTERALKLDNFGQVAKSASLDITADDDKGLYKKNNAKKWDRKSKKFVSGESSIKRIRTEEGTWVPASYKSGRYKSWMEKQKVQFAGDDEPSAPKKGRLAATGAKVRSEKRSAAEIVKERKRKERIRNHQDKRRQERSGKGGKRH